MCPPVGGRRAAAGLPEVHRVHGGRDVIDHDHDDAGAEPEPSGPQGGDDATRVEMTLDHSAGDRRMIATIEQFMMKCLPIAGADEGDFAASGRVLLARDLAVLAALDAARRIFARIHPDDDHDDHEPPNRG